MTAEEVVSALNLQPHPEGGLFVETWRHEARGSERGAGTAIYFLLKAGAPSAWHRIDATEIWHFYAGSPLRLKQAQNTNETSLVLGPDLLQGQRPQLLVPPDTWQSAGTLGDWTLVGCTVSPAFDFARFELAPKGWEPGNGAPE